MAGDSVLGISPREPEPQLRRGAEIGISYLANTSVFLRHLEIDGELRKAIGVLKKRFNDFETTLREMSLTRYGLKVGNPLHGLRGMLSGTPQWVGERPPAE